MAKGLRIVNQRKNMIEWSRQVEDCRNSGLSVRAWCEQNNIAVSTFHYRQQKIWDALNQQQNQFIEFPIPVDEYHNEIAATIHFGDIKADIHNGVHKETLEALCKALKSC